MVADIIKKLKRNLPPIFGRQAIPDLFPGIFKSQTLNTLHYEKKGPPSVKVGRKSVYERDSFIAWLANRMYEKGEDENP